MTKNINVLIIGAGRMGVRHAQGLLGLNEIESITLADINQASLDNASNALGDEKCNFMLLDAIAEQDSYDICIIAATAGDRIKLLEIANKLKCKHCLIEKPLGQSLREVTELSDYILKNDLKCAVNLNMRLYESFINLKEDLQTLPQFNGEKTITINTGSLGIGANGIHYLDLLYFLLDADEAVLIDGDIDGMVIPSGRGPQFSDFGGWALIKFFKQGEYLGKVFLSMSALSTAFGAWDIVGPHGRIYFSEVEARRIDTLRNKDSQLPISRYFGDYQPPIETKIESPFLGELTAKWVKGLLEGEDLLPEIDDSFKVHQLLFEWLRKSKTHQEPFPIT